jgi:putative spermidine/putrescine transport system ATP-binding protein
MKEFKKFAVKEISKAFGNKMALNDFSLTLDKGEFVTFLGPSGCGKSTALNCIAGLIPITHGEIYIDDECIDNGVKKVPAEKREFGMVFQNYALFPHLTVFNNIAFGLQLKKMSKNEIQEKVNNVLKMVHLEGYEEKFPSQMSGGEQQRVAIARCIVMEPRLLMLDEPLSNLDAKLRVDMRYEIKALHERLQLTSIYVTHDQQEALALSDRIVVMKNGYIQQIGTPEEIYSKPSNLFVADFMGFRNIWPGKLESVTASGDETEITINVNGVSMVSKSKFTGSEISRKIALQKALKGNREIFTAIRPEDVVIGEGPVNKLSCKVEIVEYLGQLCQVAAFMGNGTRVDLRSNEKVAEGEKVNLWIPSDKILVFPKGVGTYVG